MHLLIRQALQLSKFALVSALPLPQQAFVLGSGRSPYPLVHDPRATKQS